MTDYAASVEALINKKVDLAWFGASPSCRPRCAPGGRVIPLAQRGEDERFKSVFITADPAIKTLADLKGKDVSFGSKLGHLMPRSFCWAAWSPSARLQARGFSGAHDATIAAVAAGSRPGGAEHPGGEVRG